MVFHDTGAEALFAGDHVLPHITPSIGVELVRPPSPLRDYLASLRLMLPCPTHGCCPPTGRSPPRRTRGSTNCSRTTSSGSPPPRTRSPAARAPGSKSPRVLGWTRRKRRLDDLDLFNKILAVHETVAHLEVLVERGWLTRSIDDGVAHYARA